MKLNFKSKIKQLKRIKNTPHHDKQSQEEHYLKIFEKRNSKFMFDCEFYYKFQKLLKSHGFQKIKKFCNSTKLKQKELSTKGKIAVLIEFLIINNNNYRNGVSKKDNLNLLANEEKNQELNQFAQNYWEGCERKFQEYILGNLEEKMIETSRDLFEQMNNFNELLELLDCFILIPDFNYNKWKQRVKNHNLQLIKNNILKNK